MRKASGSDLEPIIVWIRQKSALIGALLKGGQLISMSMLLCEDCLGNLLQATVVVAVVFAVAAELRSCSDDMDWLDLSAVDA